MTNYSTGHEAEQIAAGYLNEQGFTVQSVNWSTPACEIDIVANKDDCVYFIEVKYRSSDSQGGGFDYITPKKLQQMKFSAQCWVQENKYEGDYELSAIEIGADFQIIEFIEEID